MTLLRNFIGGEWVAAEGVEGLADVDPASGETLATVPLSGAAEVDAAVRAARAAQPEWRAVAPQRRARAVLALREELLARREELVALVTADMGKTLADADGGRARGPEKGSSSLGRRRISVSSSLGLWPTIASTSRGEGR